jgi:phosphoglycolate phosphatase-like HAD superfamily hydrolase
MMHLVVFDVDGTLTDSSQVDAECLWQASREVLRLPSDHSPWIDDLRHATDLCIVTQHCEKRFGRPVTRSEVDLIRRRLVRLLQDKSASKESVIRQIKGASGALSRVGAARGFAIAIATGCFIASAEFKLRSAGLFDESIPMAGSDNTLSRAEIMRNAAQLADQKHGIEFSDFTYVGDGVWDVEAANNLGWNFIGIGAGKHADALRLAGAVKIIPHFEPATKLLELLSTGSPAKNA